ncbi:MAG: hypothetical protein AB1351_12630 [Thermoproteota archaeon]
MATAARYLYIGIIILAVSGSVAVYLNFQGARCLTALSQLDRSIMQPELIGELEVACAITTNSYVYSIYGVVAGAVLVIAGFMIKRRNNTS